MRVRPLIVAAACAFVAALALVTGESAVWGVHSPQGGSDRTAQARNGPTVTGPAFGVSPATTGVKGAASPTAVPDDQTPDQTDNQPEQSTDQSPSTTDSVMQQLPPLPIKIGP